MEIRHTCARKYPVSDAIGFMAIAGTGGDLTNLPGSGSFREGKWGRYFYQEREQSRENTGTLPPGNCRRTHFALSMVPKSGSKFASLNGEL